MKSFLDNPNPPEIKPFGEGAIASLIEYDAWFSAQTITTEGSEENL